jgi:hypothetical protein
MRLLNNSCEVSGRGGAQQNSGYAIFCSVLWAYVAANADALLAFANPEPAVLLTNDCALVIEQCEANGLVCGGFDEERAIGLDWRSTESEWLSVCILRFQVASCVSRRTAAGADFKLSSRD